MRWNRRMRKTVSATSNIQGDGTQNSSLSTNGRTSWMEEDDEQTARKILQARNICGRSGTMPNLSRMPESST